MFARVFPHLSSIQPLVWAIVEEEDRFVRLEAFSKSAPPARNKSSCSCEFDSLQDLLCESLGVIDDDAAKSHIDWLTSLFQPGRKVCWRLVDRRFAEEEAADICTLSQHAGTNALLGKALIPICEGQSSGRGTNAGDQQ